MLECIKQYFRSLRDKLANFRPIVKLIIWIVILILFSAVYFFIIPDLITGNTRNLTDSILQLLLAIVVAYLFVDYTFHENQRLEYFDALGKLLTEMRDNYEKAINFPQKIEDNYSDWKNANNWNWIGKESSYTNWGDGQNFHLKYFPTNAFFNFVNKGYILDKDFLSLPTEHIAHFYQFCNRFNIELQRIENQLRSVETNKLGLTTDCSGNIYLPKKMLGSNGKIEIFFPLMDEKKEFESKRTVCNFLKDDFFRYYAYKNDLNEGLIKEFQITLESTKNSPEVEKIWEKINQPYSSVVPHI